MLDRPTDSATSPRADASAYHDGLPGSTGDLIILVGRICIGWLFVSYGYGKLFTISAFTAGLAKQGVPASDVLGVIAPCVEFFGGLAIILGLKVRYVAPLMILFTIAATSISHRYWEYPDAARAAQAGNFYKNVAIIGGFLFLIACGAGRFSIDGLLRRRAG